MFYLHVGTGAEEFVAKEAAIAAGYEQQKNGGPDVWTVEDAEGFIVFQEFPETKWV